MIGIYKFTNKYNRKVYIGQSINIDGRRKAHISAALNNKDNNKSHFYKAIRKYGIDSFDFDILIECSKYNLDYWERFYIRYYCATNRKYGYNIDEGGWLWGNNHTPWNKGLNKETDDRIKQYGEKQKGRIVSEETKEKMRVSALNRSPVSEETKSKISKRVSGEGNPMYGKSAMKGKHHSDESKQKIREGNLGKKHSEESKLKMRHPKSDTSNMYKHTGDHWYHLGEKNVLLKPDKISYYESLGYKKGRFIPKRGSSKLKDRHWYKDPVTNKRIYYE